MVSVRDREEMSTQNQNQIEVAEDQRTPLLLHHDYSSILIAHTNSNNAHQNEDTILPFPDKGKAIPNQRLASLDVFRGLTVAVRPHFSTLSPLP